MASGAASDALRLPEEGGLMSSLTLGGFSAASSPVGPWKGHFLG